MGEETGQNSNLFLRLEAFFINLLSEAGETTKELFSTPTRGGIFSPALTMFLMVCQRSSERQTLVGALEELEKGSGSAILEKNSRNRRARIHGVSLNSGGYSRARSRLSLEKVKSIVELLSRTLIQNCPGAGRWKGRDVYLMDGTMIGISRSKRNQEKYPPTRNQHRESHTSEMICTCVHSLTTGVALAPAYGAYRGKDAIGEVSLCRNMIEQLPKGSLLVGDRNFGSFPVVYWAQQHGVDVLFRLSVKKAQSLLRRNPPSKDVEEEVTWHVSKSTQKAHSEIDLAVEIKGRLIRHTVRRKGYRPLALLFFTTANESASDLTALYQKREHIENDIRSLKYAIGLELIHAKTPEMIEKEILLGVLAYNLLRSIIAKGAEKLKIPARQISFTRAAALVEICGAKILHATSKVQEKEITERFLTGLQQSKLPNRPKQRIEPRQVVRKKQLFPLMKGSREAARKGAMKVLEKHGHRGYFTTVTRQH